jgi:hypothetical protein
MANLPSTTNSTQNFFNGYYSQAVNISQDKYGIIFSFFRARTGDDSSAASLTQALITLTYNNNLDALAMLKEFDNATSESEFKKLIIAFFNSTKGPTSKIGYENPRQTNQYVTRTILP